MAKWRKYWTWKSNNKNNISNNFGNAPTLCFTLIAYMTNIRQEQAKLRAFFFMCLYSVYLVISSEILYNSNREREYHKSLRISDWLRSFKKRFSSISWNDRTLRFLCWPEMSKEFTVLTFSSKNDKFQPTFPKHFAAVSIPLNILHVIKHIALSPSLSSTQKSIW